MKQLPITVKICTPLPVPIDELDQLNKLAAVLAQAAGVPDGQVWLRQEDNDLVVWFTVPTGPDPESSPVKQPDVVENLVAAADLLKRAYGTTATTTRNIRLGGVIIGWMSCGLGWNWYYVLRDGRHGGPAESSPVCRMAAIERNADGETQ